MYFLRLIRPINLLIIAFTMYSTRMFLYVYEQTFNTETIKKSGEEIDFFLLVFSTVLIAAAGNIINDYFDVKADRINKPNKLIITKHINRKWAILSHWVLNFIAFSIVIYLSVRNNTFWYVFIHLLSINSLWFYSMYFKRKPLIGNFIIAGLTALVPILCGVHFYIQHQFPPIGSPDLTTSFSYWIYQLEHGHFIYILAFFAFSANFSREIVKDIEDMEGDKLLSAKTFPILYGINKSKCVAIILLLLSPIFFSILFFTKLHPELVNFTENLIVFLPVFIALLIDLISIVMLLRANTRNQFQKIDLLIKISMLMGLLLPFYWLIF